MRSKIFLPALLLLLTYELAHAQSFVMVDPFETHNWHAIGFSDDAGSGEYSTVWTTQGKTSYKMTVKHQGQGFFIFGSGVFEEEAPDYLEFDVRAESKMNLEIKIVDANNTEHLLGSVSLEAGQERLNRTVGLNGKKMRKVYLVPAGYGPGTHVIYLDNMRVLKNGQETLWDGFEQHFYWDGSGDADNPDTVTTRADDITHAIASPNFSSTASLIMEWDAQVDDSANFAQIQVRNVDLDYGNYYYFRFDAYRPSTTPNVALYIFLYDGAKGAGTNLIRLHTPNQWTTCTVLLGETLALEHVTEIKFVVPFTDSAQYASGRLYFDNLQVGGFIPRNAPADLNDFGFPHVLKDFSEGLDGNNFYGLSNIGSGNGATLTRQLSRDVFFTEPAMRLDYDVNPHDSFVFYVNTLALNSVKNKLALYLKGGSTNPSRLKVEFHDGNWSRSKFLEGGAFAVLSGISSSDWKQWIVPIAPDSLWVLGSFDPSDIREVVLSLDHRNTDDQAKSGAVYVDDITFVDQTEGLTPYPGLRFPEPVPKDVRAMGVPYLLDDFDGRVLDKDGKVINQGFNEFFGLASAGYDTARWKDLALGSISSTEKGGIAHSAPFSYKINYSFDPDSTEQFAFYYNTLAPEKSSAKLRDFSFLEKFSIWLRAGNEGNPGSVVLEFHDDTWQSSQFKTGKAACVLHGLAPGVWQQWLVPVNKDSLMITGDIDFQKITEVVISFDVARVKDKSGTFYIDDAHFIDTDEKYVTASDFQKEEFLELISKRTFQYFLDAVDDSTGLVLDRVHFRDLATVAGTGFGLTAMCIGVERGWIGRTEAESYIKKVLDNLLSTDQGPEPIGNSGYKGFFYHFLEAKTGLRKDTNVELSIVDTALLLAGALTAREYFSSNSEIVKNVDALYARVEWPWFLNTAHPDSPNFNQFRLGWVPEGEKFSGHWDFATDEVILINLLAIGSPTHPVSADVFYAWTRELGTYNGHTLWQSFFGSMFQYFFANCWYDLHGKKDALGVNWWGNSVKAGLANRDFCIAGRDGLGRQNVPTYHANSWGLSSAEAIPAGVDTCYFGENGALPNGFSDARRGGKLSEQIDGTVPVYGGLSMIGFCREPEGIPIDYVTDMAQHYYQNTQLWTGWYGFRDAYMDSMSLKNYTNKRAISRFPIYKSSYFAIDQGPILLMIENYRSRLIWDTFMRNASVKLAVDTVFDTTSTSVNDHSSDLPKVFKLHQNYPNPFNPVTEIIYELPVRAHVKVVIFNVLGQSVRTLVNKRNPAGRYAAHWNGKDEQGLPAPNGVYLCKFSAQEIVLTRKMLLLR